MSHCCAVLLCCTALFMLACTAGGRGGVCVCALLPSQGREHAIAIHPVWALARAKLIYPLSPWLICRVPADVKTKIEECVTTLKAAVSSEDVPGMKSGMEALQKEVMAMGQAMYSQPAEGAAPGPEGAAPGAEPKKGGDDNVIDAEFTDDKK